MLDKFLPADWQLSDQHQKTYAHSQTVAKAARKIAAHTSVIDPEKAYTYGLMHDVGKFYISNKNEKYKHPRVGYELMHAENPDIAIICITHPFPNLMKNYEHILQYCHNDETEAKRVYEILKNIEVDDYIELIQFCDKVSRLDDYISWEEKLNWYLDTYKLDLDVLVRQYSNRLKQIKQKFDKLSGCDTYALLDIAV